MSAEIICAYHKTVTLTSLTMYNEVPLWKLTKIEGLLTQQLV